MIDIYPFFILLGISLLMDAVWLSYRFEYHKTLILTIQKDSLEINVVPAVLVYLLIATALYWVIYVVAPPSLQRDPLKAAGTGALMGFFMYGLYDLTNLATLKQYTLSMTIVDILWGTFLCGTATGVTAYLVK